MEIIKNISSYKTISFDYTSIFINKKYDYYKLSSQGISIIFDDESSMYIHMLNITQFFNIPSIYPYRMYKNNIQDTKSFTGLRLKNIEKGYQSVRLIFQDNYIIEILYSGEIDIRIDAISNFSNHNKYLYNRLIESGFQYSTNNALFHNGAYYVFNIFRNIEMITIYVLEDNYYAFQYFIDKYCVCDQVDDLIEALNSYV